MFSQMRISVSSSQEDHQALLCSASLSGVWKLQAVGCIHPTTPSNIFLLSGITVVGSPMSENQSFIYLACFHSCLGQENKLTPLSPHGHR